MAGQLLAAFVTDLSDRVDYAFSVYLVNDSDVHFPSVKLLTGAYTMDDGDYIETSKAVKDFGDALGARTCLEIDRSNRFELDFVVSYCLDFLNDRGVYFQNRCSIPKSACLDEEQWVYVPLLGRRAFVLSMRNREGESIDEIVKTLEMGPVYLV